MPTIDLDHRIEEWRKQLLDTSKRNRLISCKIGKTGALSLEHPSTLEIWKCIVVENESLEFAWKAELLSDGDEGTPIDSAQVPQTGDEGQASENRASEGDLEACLQSPELDALDLLTRSTDKALAGKLTRLSLAAKTSLSEQGVNNLFLAFGILTWFESVDSDVELLSPLILVPAKLFRPSADSRWELSTLEEELIPNHSLLQLMKTSFDLELPAFDEEKLQADESELSSYFERVREVISQHERWGLREQAVLGAFGFQKIAMWKDLGDNKPKLAGHNLCRGIAGDTESLTGGDGFIDAKELDESCDPKHTHHILDCDSSQHAAIEAVKQGASLIVDGPPGTGKSQTIANIIAEYLANDRTVLFVSEKAAALEVVKRRLDQRQIGDFCLECHSHKSNKKAVITELGRCLNLHPEQYETQEDDLLELQRTRRALNGYVRALHVRRSALNLSAYAVHGRLASIQCDVKTRCTVPDVSETDNARLKEMLAAINELASVQAIVDAGGIHPWRGCNAGRYSLTLEDDIRHHFTRCAGLLSAKLEATRGLMQLGFLQENPRLEQIDAAMTAAKTAAKFPSVPQAWFAHGAREIATGYRKLAQLSSDYKTQRSRCTDYNASAIETIDPRIAERLTADDHWTMRIQRPDNPTLRATLSSATQARSELDALLSEVKRLSEAVTRVRTLLMLEGNPETRIDGVPKLIAFARQAADLGCAHPSWFDEDARRKISIVAAKCAEGSKLALSYSSTLTQRFSSAAFGELAQPEVEKVCQFNSFFRRLRPAWRVARDAFTVLYTSTVPRRAGVLIEDATKLLRYHRVTKAIRDEASPVLEQLQWSGSVDFDWQGLQQRLKLSEQLPPTGLLSSRLIEALSRASGIEKEPLLEAARDLQDAADNVTKRAGTANKAYRLAKPENGEERAGAFTPDEFIGWLTQARTAVETRCDELKRASLFLKDGADVHLHSVADDVQLLLKLRELRDEALSVSQQIGEKLPDISENSLGDWTAQANLGSWLQSFLESYHDQPPRQLVAVISNPTVRDSLEKAITAIEAATPEELHSSWSFVTHLFEPGAVISDGIRLKEQSVAQLIEWLKMRASDAHRLRDWLSFRTACEHLDQTGLKELKNEILSRSVPVPSAAKAFLIRFYRLWLDSVYAADPALAEFELERHERLVERFRNLDRAFIENSFARIRSTRLSEALRVAASSFAAPASSELGILKREVNKKRRHLSLRQLFRQIPSLLLKLKPCIMMSPLAVSTFLDSDRLNFDLVIFDEASQVRPHDAVCAVYRGKQLVVAGDQKQLPPTSFFERSSGVIESDEDYDEEEIGGTEDFESILDVCATLRLPRQRLKWHYRSKRESLIAFSNRHFYEDELITFPSSQDVDNSSGVHFEFVANGEWKGGASGGINAAEVQRAADLVMQHARTQPEKSLGVITMNQTQQLALIEEIESRRRSSAKFEEFFSENLKEPFFVKNLENVQGDERDVIIVSVGYAKNGSGVLSHNFGPLNRQGGERRLNVAVTRAKSSLTLISSIKADDVDLSRTQSVGARLLRAYLDFAERGTAALRSEVEETAHGFDSEFEAEVARSLRARGLEVRPQIGCSGFRVDLALVDPARPGKYVLGVECDGATYHSSATARDRDRLRQEILESLGWKICRIWSTDWIRDPNRQIERVIDAYQRARNISSDEERPRRGPINHVQRKAGSPPLQPVASSGFTRRYATINHVPANQIESMVTSLLSSFGATEKDELIRSVAKQLGFDRTGGRIKQRIQRIIDSLRKRSVIRLDESGRLCHG